MRRVNVSLNDTDFLSLEAVARDMRLPVGAAARGLLVRGANHYLTEKRLADENEKPGGFTQLNLFRKGGKR